MAQMALPLKLADHAIFDSFVATGNEVPVAALRDIASGAHAGAYLWGAPASGKSHLLQAVCAEVGDRSVYVPLGAFAASGPAAIEGLARRDVICIDDLDAIAGDEDWELGLFRLYNDVLARGARVVFAANLALRETGIRLPDLASRLAQLPGYRLEALGDAGRVEALKLRAELRGLELPEETARYLLTHSRRDMASLYATLDRLDDEALRAQRKLTVPFVSGVLKRSFES
ncbi:MAG: DnaA regulatory inactivator Hda [Pseudomonadota bacterium]